LVLTLEWLEKLRMNVVTRNIVLYRDLGLVVSLWSDVIGLVTLRQWPVQRTVAIITAVVIIIIVIALRQWYIETLEGEVTLRYWSSLRLMS